MNSVAGVALVGSGFISYFHVLAARRLPAVRLAALASRSQATAEHRARLFACEPYSFEALPSMLGRDDVDIVVVESPVYLHAAHAEAALRAGKHVIVEKPLALTLAEAAAIEAAARAAGRAVGYAENQVFTPLALKARELIESGAIGNVRRVAGIFKHGGPPRDTWFWQPALGGGGAHLDLGAHALETSLFLAGFPEVTRVASCRVQRDVGGVDVVADAVIETVTGVEVRTESSWSEPKESCVFHVTGDEGTIEARFSPPPQWLTLRRSSGEDVIEVPGQFDLRFDAILAGMGYAGQMEHFVSCFRSGDEPRESARDGARVLRILAAGYLAAGRGAAVDVSEVPVDRPPIALLEA